MAIIGLEDLSGNFMFHRLPRPKNCKHVESTGRPGDRTCDVPVCLFGKGVPLTPTRESPFSLMDIHSLEINQKKRAIFAHGNSLWKGEGAPSLCPIEGQWGLALFRHGFSYTTERSMQHAVMYGRFCMLELQPLQRARTMNYPLSMLVSLKHTGQSGLTSLRSLPCPSV